MARSSKKGPYVDERLIKRVSAGMGEKGKAIKTWARGSTIEPKFVGKYFSVHNGRAFVDVFVTEDMVGHKFGEFAPTRTFYGHAGDKKSRIKGVKK